MRFFNTAGPVNSEKHYCLPPLSRFDLPEVLTLISQEKYFVLHAPRQSGKTSCLLALQDYLNKTEQFIGIYINVEIAQAARENVPEGVKAIVDELIKRVEQSGFPLTSPLIRDDLLKTGNPFFLLNKALSSLSSFSEKPVILFIDEIDALVGDTLISVLRQLRSGYDTRPTHFPSSVILCGVRDVRDYRIHSDKDKAIITGGSAFNIKAKSLRLGNFSEEETRTLCLQHTKETGQIFESASLDSIWTLTQGQPWLVNALAYETCFELDQGKDRKNPITPSLVEEAKEQIIIRRETHLDQLADKLKEERVLRVIEPILTGERYEGMFQADDIDYVTDLGLIIQSRNGEIKISNPIYQEIIPRQLSWESQSGMAIQQSWFVNETGRLNMKALLEEFRQFFREHSESWLERFSYKEAGPQLLLQAFLQRIVNGGGRIDREYGLGKKRTDLLIIWKLPDGSLQRIVIELKILYKSRELTIKEGMEQIFGYADRCGADEAYLIIFDRTAGKPWEEKIFEEERIYAGTDEHPARFPVIVWGM